MISMLKLSTLASSLFLIIYAPQALAEQEQLNYTIEFAQPAAAPASAAGAANTAGTANTVGVANTANAAAANRATAPAAAPAPQAVQPAAQRTVQPATAPAQASVRSAAPVTQNNAPVHFGSSSSVAPAAQARNADPTVTAVSNVPVNTTAVPAATAAAAPATTMQEMPQFVSQPRVATPTTTQGTTGTPAAQFQAAGTQPAPMGSATPFPNQAGAANAPRAQAMQGQVAPAMPANNAAPMASSVANTQAVGTGAAGAVGTGAAGTRAVGTGAAGTGAAGAAAFDQGMASSEYEVETINTQAQAQQDAALRQDVTDQLYPASLNENGTDDFYQSETARFNAAMQGQAQPNNQGFTFENADGQQPAAPEKPSNVFPLGSHAITAPDGRQIMVGPDGKPLLDANGQPIPAPLEQIQEVSVMMLTTLDNALINAFKSLESGLTLGLGQNKYEYTLDDIAPAIRGYSFAEDGNLLVRFSVNAAESVIKRHGTLSWNGLSNPILVWMVGLDEVNHSNKLSLVSGQNLSTFAQAILNAAPEYKYRLMFPILDLEDVQKVQVGTVLNHQDNILAEASQRYGADYFISAAIDNVNSDGTGVALKWNLYTKKGQLIAQSALSGLVEEVASLGANDIARAVMTYQEEQRRNPEAKPEDHKPSEMNANNVDINRLGAGDGFIRIRVENVRALSDFQAMRKAFVTYGYDGDIRIVGYDNGAMILEVVTNSDIVHLEGTLRRAGDFTYLAPWTYQFNSTAAPRRNVQRPAFSATDSTSGAHNLQRPNPVQPQQYPVTNTASTTTP